MDITPRELRDVEIRESFRGYNRDDVNELLERAAATLDAADARMQQMNERLTTVQSETGHTRETEDILHRTLLLAQRAADEAVGEATAKARQMLDDAEIQSRRLIADSEADARRRGETERRRLEEEVLDLASRRDSLLADVEALTRFEADYRDRMVRTLEADLSALRSRPPASPGPRPDTSEVDLPVPSEAFMRREPAEPAAPPDQPFAAQPAASVSSPAPVANPTPLAAQPSPSPFTTSPGPDAPRSSGYEPSTQAVDVQSLFDRAGAGSGVSSAPLAFEQPATAASPPPAPVPPPRPPETPSKPPESFNTPGAFNKTATASGDALEAEVLDDDTFFATLREAVHDETPLGPRDEDDATGENSFFDQEADSAGFRDVFRRRR